MAGKSEDAAIFFIPQATHFELSPNQIKWQQQQESTKASDGLLGKLIIIIHLHISRYYSLFSSKKKSHRLAPTMVN